MPRSGGLQWRTIFSQRAQAMSPGKRRDMIEPDHPKLSLSAQCRVLNISRSTLYYKPLPASGETLALMKAIDKLFTKYPFFGSGLVGAGWY